MGQNQPKSIFIVLRIIQLRLIMKTIENLRSFAKLNMSPSCFRHYEMFIEPTIKYWLFNPIDDWRDVESNITQMVMITKEVFKGKIEILDSDEGLYLFRWNKIPVRDTWKLIKFLNQNYNIDWVKTSKIKINNGGKTIKLFTEKNYLSLTLNHEKTKVNLNIDDVRTDEFIVKKVVVKKGEVLKIYKEGSSGAFGEEIDWEKFQDIKGWPFTRKIDTLHTAKILGDFSFRVLDEANDVRNKIHNPFAPFSEQDIKLFGIAKVVTGNLLAATRNGFGKDIAKNYKNIAEKCAEQCLLKLNLGDYSNTN